MLRLALIIAAVSLLALPSLDAGARGKDKDKGKPKLCATVGGNSALPRDRCLDQKGANIPTQLQIGGPSFGSGGSTFKGGAPGDSLNRPPAATPVAPGMSGKAK